jgi:hypothetical protein
MSSEIGTHGSAPYTEHGASERSLIQERVRAGLRNARAKRKKFGRPRAQVDASRMAALRGEGLSWSQVCQKLTVSKVCDIFSWGRWGRGGDTPCYSNLR